MRDASKFGAQTTASEVAEGIDLRGKLALVTGGSSGLGQETARVLAELGAHVIITARDVPKGEAVAAAIRSSTGNPRVEVAELELGSLKNIRAFAERFLSRHDALHILVDNAGVMASPFMKTQDGFELQFGSKHAALTSGTAAWIQRCGARSSARSPGSRRRPNGGLAVRSAPFSFRFARARRSACRE
jgi:NAD(P)-dependent dehydrogenase (short-subunit alcohol dehydrogenase family)